MKFLVDEAVSWQVARDLCAQGHDAVHVGDLGLSAAKDAVVLDRALAEDRVVITQDTDFGTLLAGSGARRPSVILLRLRDGQPAVHARALLQAAAAIEADVQAGAVVVVSEDHVRIRRLPLAQDRRGAGAEPA